MRILGVEKETELGLGIDTWHDRVQVAILVPSRDIKTSFGCANVAELDKIVESGGISLSPPKPWPGSVGMTMYLARPDDQATLGARPSQ